MGIKLEDVGVAEQGAGSTRSDEARLMSCLTWGYENTTKHAATDP